MKKVSSIFAVLTALSGHPTVAESHFEFPESSERILIGVFKTDANGAAGSFFHLGRYDSVCSRIDSAGVAGISEASAVSEPYEVTDVADDLPACHMLRAARMIEWQLQKSKLFCRFNSKVLTAAPGRREVLQLADNCQCLVMQSDVANEVSLARLLAVPFYFCLPFFKENAVKVSTALDPLRQRNRRR